MVCAAILNEQHRMNELVDLYQAANADMFDPVESVSLSSTLDAVESA